ncbi:MAG: NrsF family protein [Caulobacter sp.]
MRTNDLIQLLAADLPTHPGDVETALRRWPLISAAVVGMGFLAVFGVRADLTTAGLAPTLVKLAMGALLAVGAAIGAAKLARPDISAAPFAKWLAGVFFFLAFLVAMDGASAGLDGWLNRLSGKSILTCLTVIPALAALPLAASLLALRLGATMRPVVSGALAGLASAGLAILAFGFYCIEDSPLFVAAWYALAAAIVALAGAALGRVMLRW